LYVNFSAINLRGGKVWVDVAYRPPGKGFEDIKFVGHTISIPAVSYKEERHTLFLPFSKMHVAPKRYGMQHVKLLIEISDEEENVLAEDNNFCLDFALGSYYLAKHGLMEKAAHVG